MLATAGLQELFACHVRVIALVAFEADQLTADWTLEVDLVLKASLGHTRTPFLGADAN